MSTALDHPGRRSRERRMNSDLPKVLHEIAGAPVLIHAMAIRRDIVA